MCAYIWKHIHILITEPEITHTHAKRLYIQNEGGCNVFFMLALGIRIYQADLQDHNDNKMF